MKIQCPSCHSILQITIQKLLNRQEIICEYCREILSLHNNDGSLATLGFILTESKHDSTEKNIHTEISVAGNKDCGQLASRGYPLTND
jgi:hypothetical protein